MAIIAEFTNSVALAAEIEARTSALQAIKEGRYPSFPDAVQSNTTSPPVMPTHYAPVTAALVAPATPPAPAAPLVPAAPVVPTV